jgi:hypothetical protein
MSELDAISCPCVVIGMQTGASTLFIFHSPMIAQGILFGNLHKGESAAPPEGVLHIRFTRKLISAARSDSAAYNDFSNQ